MSRNIKTVECLSKHVGKTVKVVDDEGRTFLATVEEGPDLYTTDKKAADSTYWWWNGRDQYGHHCKRNSQITDELKSLTLVSEKKAAKKVVKEYAPVYADERTVKKNVGKFCKLYNGKIGKIVDRGDKSPLLLLKEYDSEVGWALDADSEYRKEGWEYGWNMHDQGCDTAKIVEFFDEDPTVKKKRTKKAKKVEAETKKIVLAEELKKNVGHYCEMADGSTGFIAGSAYPDNVCVLHNSDGDSDGWIISRFDRISEIKGVSEDFIKQFSKGWHVKDDEEAEEVKVVKILESSKDYKTEETPKCAESKKTIYDLTVRELLEKLNEIVIS